MSKILIGDYSEWMNTRDILDQKSYWIDEFSDGIPVLEMPLDYARPKERSFEGGVIRMDSAGSLGKQIMFLSKETGATMYMILLSALMATLGKYSRQEDIVIGSPLNARVHKDTEKMLGMFVNTLAMRGSPCGEKRYRAFLDEIKEKCIRAYENQEYPFEELVEAVGVKRDLSRNPLFDVMLVLQNNEETPYRLRGVETEEVETAHRTSRFDMTISIKEKGEEIEVWIEYCTALYKEDSVRLILRHYIGILEQVCKDPNVMIRDLETATQEERELILGDFNATKTEYPREKTVVELFEEQVERTPENIALVYEDEEMTYRELNAKANQLAARLRGDGLRPDDFVAVMAERSMEMIVGIYGILKAGGAYVPIDPEYPAERVNYILCDCRPKAVLVYGAEIEADIPVIDLGDSGVYTGSTENPERVNCPENLVYCIYTSGTTGNPKGVANIHKGLINRLIWMIREHPVGYEDILMQKTTYTFDVSVWEIFCWSIIGAKLALLKPGMEKEPKEICSAIKKYGVTIIHFVPSLLSMFEGYLERLPDETQKLISLKCIISSGEALKVEQVKKFRLIFSKFQLTADLVNCYGPTEASIDVTYFLCRKDGKTIPIGKPISNTQIYILSGEKLCGIGVPGELCIAGDGLARGYLNQPVLTSEKFVMNPYGEGRLYRSGDLARWLPDGNIEYLGRIDEQVKIRGYRIELGEIESRLREMEGICDAAAVAREDGNGNKAIYAYVVSDKAVSISGLREKLKLVLPSFMVPGYMAQIEKLPMTRNGKLDKKALPEIEAKSERGYIGPRDEIEEILCRVFTEVLGIEKVGVKDDFFELGGDSIKAMRVVSKVRDAGYEITINDIMLNTAVEYIAKACRLVENTVYEQGEVAGRIISTPIIKDFQRKKLKKPAHFNQSIMLNIGKKACEKEIMAILTCLVEHHDILRGVYRDGQLIILSVNNSRMYDFETIEAGQESSNGFVEAECTRIQASIDLENGPLMKVALIRGKEDNYLLIVLHHLVVDGISWRILTDDFKIAMSQLEKGKPISLPLKTVSFKEWSETLNDYQYSAKLNSERAYWEKVSIEAKEGRIIKKDCDENTGYGNIDIVFSESETKKLLMDSRKAFTTEVNDLLLGALSMAMGRIFGQDKLTVFVEGHGREEIHKKINIDRTVGWFTSIYPVVLYCTNNIKDSIILTKDILRGIPNHGIGYGLLQDTVSKIEADVYFNYLGEIDAEAKGGSISYSCGMNIAAENNVGGSINFNGSITQGRLGFQIGYDKSEIRDKTIKNLASAYKDCLCSMISFCTEQSVALKTAVEFFGRNGVTGINIAEDIYVLTPQLKNRMQHELEDNGDGRGQQAVQKVSKRLEVLPFKEVFYKTCFYNSLFGLFGYYNMDIHKYIINDVIYYKYNTETQILTSEYLEEKSLLDLLHEDNIHIRTGKYCEDIVGQIVNSIDNNRPSILIHDPFYNPFRRDAYYVKHFPHAILVKGYDLAKNTIYAFEHKQEDSLEYEEIEMSFSTIEKCYYSYAGKDTSALSYFEIVGYINKNLDNRELSERYKKRMIENRAILNNGLCSLREFVSTYTKLSQAELRSNINGYMNSFNSIICAKQVERYRIEYLFGKHSHQWILINKINELWNKIRMHLGRLLYFDIYNADSLNRNKEVFAELLNIEKEFINTIVTNDNPLELKNHLRLPEIFKI